LAEFSSVVDAVRCALDIQRGMAERNANVAQEKRIEFRVGINIGDIIEDGGDIFGDDVNVAARLEGIADRGGFCISRQALEQVEGKLDLAFRELGRQNLKNIANRLRCTRSSSMKRGHQRPGCSPARTSSRKFDTARHLMALGWLTRQSAPDRHW
jgi:class 3 adenylate cyclase